MKIKRTVMLLILVIMTALVMSITVEARIGPPGVQYDRQAVVNEAYYAVTGYWWYCPNVGAGQYDSRTGSYNYLLSDVGAYWHTRDYWTSAYRPYPHMTHNNDDRLTNLFLDGNLPAYGFAGGVGRGGQCKYFANVLLYRAGVSNVDPMPTYSILNQQSRSSKYAKPGDVLFKYNYHVAIVTRVLQGDPNSGTVTGVQVVDSNWVTGDDNEVIGVHNYYGSDLAQYKVWTGAPYYWYNYGYYGY